MKDPVEALRHAFDEFVLEGDGVYQKEMEAFTQRWGSITFETLKRVLTEGQGDDVVVAIFALGFLETPDTSTLRSRCSFISLTQGGAAATINISSFPDIMKWENHE